MVPKGVLWHSTGANNPTLKRYVQPSDIRPKEDTYSKEEWLEKLEAVCWKNYLTETQAEKLAASIINQDGSPGPQWSMDTFFSVVPKLGGQLDDEPYYNRYALWLVANAHYSDFARSTAEDMGYSSPEEVPGEKMALSMYRKAVESLKDADRLHYIADYYHISH